MIAIITTSLLVLAVSLWVIWRKKQFSYLKELGIPGPEPNIFFGNLWGLARTDTLKCYENWIKKYGKVFGYYFGNKPVVVIADLDSIRQIQIKEFNSFIDRPLIVGSRGDQRFGTNLIVQQGQAWKDVRSVLTPSFTSGKLKGMIPAFSNAIDDLISNISKKGEGGKTFNIYPLYQQLTMDVIGRTAFGIQTNVQKDPNDPFLKMARIIFEGQLKNLLFITLVSFGEFFKLLNPVVKLVSRLKHSGVDAVQELQEKTMQVIQMRKKDPSLHRPDLLQLLLDAQHAGLKSNSATADDLTAGGEESEDAQHKPTGNVLSKSGRTIMSDNDIRANALLMFLAGYETTSTALAYITHNLVQHPEIQEKVQQEIDQLLEEKGELDYSAIQNLKYLDCVVSESIRLNPPIYLFVNREAVHDTTIGKWKIPKGTMVQVPVYHVNHDPEYWTDPEKFIPERFMPENRKNINPLAFQSFGNGPRNCVGMRFAQMEIKMALCKILSKFTFEESSETEKDPLTLRVTTATLTPKNGIKVIVTPRD